MLCHNCNYILSGEEAFCPHCGQAVKTQENEKDEEQSDISLKVTEMPSKKKKPTIFDEEAIEIPDSEAERQESKKSKSAVAVVSLFVLILVTVAVFACLEYFDLMPAIASFLSDEPTSDSSASALVSSELNGSEGMVPPEISYKSSIHTVTSQKPLPLRKGPDDTYAPIDYIPQGTRLQITGGCLTSDNWVYVYIPSEDIYGWLNAAFLMQDNVPLSTTLPASQQENDTSEAESTTKSEEEKEKTTLAPQKKTAKITAEKGLYLRVGPGVDFDAVTVIGKDEEVVLIEVCESNPSWVLVQFGKDKGYVSRNYISGENI